MKKTVLSLEYELTKTRLTQGLKKSFDAVFFENPGESHE